MKDFSYLLSAFGGSCGFIVLFLYQRSLSVLMQYMKTNHHNIWLSLNKPDDNKILDSFIGNQKTRKFVINKHYEKYTDVFLNKLGSVLRVRLLFILFCLICLVTGIILFTISILWL